MLAILILIMRTWGRLFPPPMTTRVEHVKAHGRTRDLKAAEHGSVAGSEASAGLEETVWLWVGLGSERGGRNPTLRADRRERLAFRGVYPIQWSKTRIRSIP